MKRIDRRIEADLAVIGAGIAGFATSIFALQHGLKTIQMGHSGAIAYTTGYLDLLGAPDGRKLISDPWAGLKALRETQPRHPLARISAPDIRTAMHEFAAAVTETGLAYTPPGDKNVEALLPAGLTKPALCLPATMAPGARALNENARTLIIGIEGLQGFSAREFRANMARRWPALRAAKIAFPEMEDRQVFAEAMARALEVPSTRETFAARIREVMRNETHIGLPAILGMHAPDEVRADMQARLGATIFEIPTIPPAVPGIRLRELFEREMPARGLMLEPQLKVLKTRWNSDGAALFLRGPLEDITVRARAVILSTGRFLSGGLQARRDGVIETLMNLPVSQPASRDKWHRTDYMDPRGHPLNSSGIEVDNTFRPLDESGMPVHEGLFAAGSILAHQDWARQRCGAGLAIATASRAVEAARAYIRS